MNQQHTRTTTEQEALLQGYLEYALSDKPLVMRAAILRLEKQYEHNSDSNLCFAVVCSAILDLEEENHRDSAKTYLKGEMVHAQLIGLDPDWIRATLKELRLMR